MHAFLVLLLMLELQTSDFGQLQDGRRCQQFRIFDAKGLRFAATNYGAAITHLYVPDAEGRLDDVVLGFDSVADYENDPHYIGATVGRFANRIAGASYLRDGEIVSLSANEGRNHLHGGFSGFDKQIWECEPEMVDQQTVRLPFRYTSAAGEEGYPGKLNCQVEITFTNSPTTQVEIAYRATSDQDTPLNITHHEYWNLAGAARENDILDHELQINAAQYLPTNGADLPTGEIKLVEGTAFDFMEKRTVREMNRAFTGQLPNGYDHCYALSGYEEGVPQKIEADQPAAILSEPASGRVMKLFTTYPGLQFYTAGFMGETSAKAGAAYHRFKGLCLEAQHFPDAINQQHFPAAMLKAGEAYTHRTIYKFENPIR